MISILLFALTTCKGVDDIIDPTNEEKGNALLLSFGAGLSTVLGAVAALWISKEDLEKQQSTFLAGCLSFAAAVMIYVSFVALWPEAKDQFESVTEDEQVIHVYTSMSFFSGVVMSFLFDRGAAWFQNSSNNRKNDVNKKLAVEMQSDVKKSAKMDGDESRESSVIVEAVGEDEKKAEIMRTALVTAVSIALHNFPEGLVAFLAAVADWEVGVATAFAVAIHNIPEGISIAVPYYYASESRWKAFALTFIAGLAEPLGALIGWAILGDIWGNEVFATLFALTGGIMCYISFSSLIPLAISNDPDDKVTTIMLFIGMMAIDVSLTLEKG